LAHVVSVVKFGTRLAPLMAVEAELCDCPMTEGTGTHGPFETATLTGVLGGTLAPAPGFWADTCPLAYPLEHSLDWLPTVRPARASVPPAAVGDCPSTLGTETDVWVPETVSCTGTVCLTWDPAVGLWDNTIPCGWLLETVLTV
jgi:hypothetical protein